jgi:hypothetical protein
MIVAVTRTRAVLAALSCLSVLVLGACSEDDPKPRLAPAPSGSDSPKASASPSSVAEPTMPTVASDDSEAGAEAFVRYWIEMVNYAQRTGDTSGFEELNDIRCAGCRGMVDAIDSAYSAGGHIEGGTLRAGRLRGLPVDFGAEWAGFARARTSAQTVMHGDGTKESHGGAPFDLYTYLDWDDGWSMRWLRTPS